MIQLKKPMIINFEGIDGTFKYTNACKLQEYIEDNYTSNVIVVSFPNYNGESSYLLREYFKSNRHKQQLSPRMISELFMLDMYDSYYKEIQEFYNKNYIIIFDRYWYSNIYYQGASFVLENNTNDTDYESFFKNNESKYRRFERMLNNLNETEFKLPKSNIIYSMIHNLMPSYTVINQRRNSDSSHNDEINEDQYKYLDQVNYCLKQFPFSYGETYFKQYIIEVDETPDKNKSGEEIFNTIKEKFDEDIKKFIKES